MTPATTTEHLCRDVFPAEVACPDGRVLRDVRAFVTTGRLIVWAVSDGQPTMVLNVPLSEPGSVEPSRMLSMYGTVGAQTPGGVYHVNRGRGCGCTGPTRVLKALGAPVPWA